MSFIINILRFRRAFSCAAGLAIAIGGAGVSPCTADTPLVDEYRTIFRTQTPEGALAFDGSQRFFADHPSLATLCLVENAVSPNAAFVSQSVSAIGRYYTYLFGARDRDGNLLVETTDADGGDVEDAGFNALLALDMQSLARLCVEIKRPYQALYWYEGARAVQEAVIHAGFDARSGFFLPRAVSSGERLVRYHALSIAPLLFPGRVGDNHASIVIRQYALDGTPRSPESPHDYLAGSFADGADDAAASSRVFKTLVVLDALEGRGFTTQAIAARVQSAHRARRALDALVQGGALPSGHHLHFVDRLEAQERRALHDPTVSLVVFEAVMASARTLEETEFVRFRSSVAEVRRFVATPLDEAVKESDVTSTEASLRVVYQALSTVREALDGRTFFPSDAYRAVGGMDPAIAMDHVLDDVAAALQRCENNVFERRNRDGGLRAAATLLTERAILGGPIRVKWTLRTERASMTIASASMVVGSDVYPLVTPEEGLVLQPDAPATRVAQFQITHGQIDTLEPLTLTLDVDDGSGKRIRTHEFRTVYLEHPVDVTASFPRGRVLAGESVPLEVTMVKRTPTPTKVRYEWFSPTGLRLVEGRTAEYTMRVDEDSTTLRLNVVVPTPCRPGRFPFKLKFYGNGSDVGTVASTLFKPYQWAFIGPFPAKSAGLPPEQRVDLLAEYNGEGRRVSWAVVGVGAHNAQGDVSLRGLLPDSKRPVVSYLYTVIEASDATSSPLFLSSNAPATLFVNGNAVLETSPADGAPAYARVELAPGANSILVKLVGTAATRVFFNLGDENDETSYGFNNNMQELAAGFAELQRRSQGHGETPREAQKLVTLRYRDPSAHDVSVIGTFNGWSPDQSRMQRLGSGDWEIVLSLPPGKHAYRFLVNNREQVLDPNSPAVEPDGFGGENSVLFVE